MTHNQTLRWIGPSCFMIALAVALLSPPTQAATWKGLEPFVSKRADVERVLGPSASDQLTADGTLHYNVAGDKVTIFFVSSRFIASKKLSPALEGTVLQIVIEHEGATDTPTSLNLSGNSSFKRQRKGGMDVYKNAEEGVSYTFQDTHLKTTRFSH